jgi:hypothetical protein
MKSSLMLAMLLAFAVPAPASRAEDEPKADPPRAAGPDETAETPKKEKPRRPEGAGEKPGRPEARPKPGEPRHGHSPRGEMPGKRTWLGISTHPLDPALGEHLEIPEGFGIQVVEVMPDSPADQAGLRGNDILLRFEDQRLISPEHLSLLVRTKKSGEKVALTLIRKGAEETVQVPLGEADENLFGPFDAPARHPHGYPMSPHFGQDPSQWQEQIRRQQDEILRQQKEWMERHHQERQREHPALPHPGPGGPGAKDNPRPEGRPPAVSVNPGFPLRVFGTSGVLNIDNDHGELTLTREDDEHHLVIKDAAGKVVYEGPFDPAKGVEALPEEARKQLEVMKLDNLEIKLPDMPVEAPEKTAEPKPDRDKPTDPEEEIL